MFFKNKYKYAIATITTPEFFTGTLVMLHSFLETNRWWKGDIIIIQDGQLTDRDLEKLSFFPNLKTMLVDKVLIEKTIELTRHFPDFKRRMGQFYSLTAFKIKEYDKILIMDSDILFRGSVESIFDTAHKLSVCRKAGKFKDPKSYTTEDPFSIEQFNAGVMLVDRSLTGAKIYEKLMKLVSLEFFSSFLKTDEKGLVIPDRFGTDQLILNTVFKDEDIEYLPMKYNYRFGIAELIFEKEGTTLWDAVLLHYTGMKKPWLLDRSLDQIQRNPSNTAAFIFWIEAYLRLQQSFSLYFKNKP
jgi:lipopolysaccharide biosynthesis glycosyltransferase